MKKIYAFMTGCFISCFLLGQTIATGQGRSGSHSFPREVSVIKQKLDSISSTSLDTITNQWTLRKQTFTYDVLENLLLQKWNSWTDSTGNWHPGSKYDYTYDAKRNMVLVQGYYWTDSTSQWSPSGKQEWAYDDDGNMILYIIYWVGYGVNPWIPDRKFEYTYDASGNITSEIESCWDGVQLYQFWKEEYLYDAFGKMIVKTGYHGVGQQWQVWEKNDYTYDASGNMVASIYSQWNMSTSQWSIHLKDEYTYDANGQLTLHIYFLASDTLTSLWIPATKEEYTYNAHGKMILEVKYSFLTANSQWDPEWKDEHIFDSNQNMTSEMKFTWNVTTGQWIPESEGKTEFTYNNAFDRDEILLPYETPVYLDNPSDHMLTGKLYYDVIAAQWVEDYKEDYYYSGIDLGISDNSAARCNIYPNPASASINIESSELLSKCQLVIMNLNGQELIRQQITERKTVINLTRLPSGIYFVKLTNERAVAVGKVIKQ